MIAATPTTAPVLLRPATDTDLPFIFATWLRHYRSSPVGKLPSSPVYFEEQHRVIEHLLSRSQVLVAADTEDSAHLFGWLVFDARSVNVVHYMFVKGAFRRMGIGRALLRAANPHDAPMFFSHLPPDARAIAWLAPKAIYNPWLGR